MPKESESSGIEATLVISKISGDGTADVNPSAGADSGTVPEGSETGFDDRYVFLSDFASGGVGQIARAEDRVFGRVVAVKSLKSEFAKDPLAVKAFLNECRLNARLDHPSIIPVYSMGLAPDGTWKAAMKLIGGTSFKKFINEIRQTYGKGKISRLQERHALMSRLEFFLKICEAVEYCHSVGIVHGDIKPDNILLGKYGEVYLLDWGCAQPEGTVPERFSGTPEYLPPEVYQTRTVRKQTDVFALGVILFELATLRHGSARCKRDSDDTCVPVMDPESYRHYIPSLMVNKRLRAIIRKAVEFEISDRYTSVTDLIRDVRAYLYDEEVSVMPDSIFMKAARFLARHRVKTLLISMLLLTLLLGGWSLTSYRALVAERRAEAETVRKLRLQAYTDILNLAVSKRFLSAKTSLEVLADTLAETQRTGSVTQAEVERLSRKSMEKESAVVRTFVSPSSGCPADGRKFPVPPEGIWSVPFQVPETEEYFLARTRVIRNDSGEGVRTVSVLVSLDRLLRAVVKANLDDPVHRLFFVPAYGPVLEIAKGKLHPLGEDAATPGAFSDSAIRDILQNLRDRKMQQMTVHDRGGTFYVSGGKMDVADAFLIQMIEGRDMANHQHVDLAVGLEE